MSFELAYDLQPTLGREIVFVRQDDRHRKVRLLLTELDEQGDTLTLTGHSLGSSYQPIKAAKKDETPVVVKGRLQRAGEQLRGSLEPA